ncbi:hypothetical protein [Cellulophaga sp. L1A9]|uniref:hypothetical protein n=1 Tax=Cellulophaga sp. L1A9 TaxID=2686362 RepID=UPI00131E6C72|nr:hypothetical protein [Cellulophaga sp. L1A9]
MKTLKSTLFKKRKSEFGNFELVPEIGWKISHSFIDFESGLLVVNESDENKKNWTDTGFGSLSIPNRIYKVDIKTGNILPAEEWTKHFSYKTKEQISTDGKYKLITTRVHEPERNTDSIKEELIELKSAKKVSSSESIAFTKEKRENLLESLYRREKEREIRKSKLASMPTLAEFYENEVKKLRQGALILEYYNSEFIFKLVYKESLFKLFKVHSKFRYDLDRNSLNYQKEESFTTIEDFVFKFLTNKAWFINHTPLNLKRDGSKSNQLLKKFIVEFFNRLRAKHDFTFDEYYKIQQWENHFYQRDSVKPEAYKQFCANCKKTVSYHPRYPKHICRDCASKTITDENGLELSFSNIGMSGGLKITYKKDGQIIKEDSSELEKLCFIEGKRYIATEAKFGGIVIQDEK